MGRPEQSARQLADDRDLATHVWARRGRLPRDRCTIDIESSTETTCLRPPTTSRSVRPRAGRITAVAPCTRWLRLSLVDTCTVKAQVRNAASVTSVSGVAEAKLPPMEKNTDARPERMARIALTVSWPGRRGLVMPNRESSAVKKDSGAFSQMPMVRSPCTLE